MMRTLPIAQESMDFSSYVALHSGDRIIPYKTVDGIELKMAIYYPNTEQEAKKGRFPLLVLVHGGGWDYRKIFPDQTAWAGDYLGYLARYFAEQGYLCVSVDYRLLTRDGVCCDLACQAEDCMDAVSYLKCHAAELNIDQNRTAVLGESAGGHLAACLVTLPLRPHSFFKTAVLVNPVTDLTDPKWQRLVTREKEGSVLCGKSLADRLFLFSPANHMEKNTCPVLLLHGREDRTVCPLHSVKMHDSLCQQGVESELYLLEETDHAFLLTEYMKELGRDSKAATTAIPIIRTWLKKQFMENQED